MGVLKTLWVAGLMKDYERIYFPQQLDFRGRMYPVPMFLQPQGDDFAKGMLTFADGKPINDGVAAGWLAIHGANCFGHDKVSLEDRIQWVDDHEHLVGAVAHAPLHHLWWTEADKPWQFLAWCMEWAAFKRQGFGYVSSLPVSLDGSCSGIQHFSAMLKDERGGEAVNLLPSQTPRDIYQEVADVVYERVLQEQGDPEVGAFARTWLDNLGINRKLTKRSVMIVPYSGTPYAARKYIEEYVREVGVPGEWENNTFNLTLYMTRHVWAAIGQVVVSSRVVMNWLKTLAKQKAADELPVHWTTPLGFPVLQSYRDLSRRRVRTKLGDSIVYLTLAYEQDKVDKKRMESGISPNYVHSMDAAHLQLSVCYCRDNGLTAFSMIHDSFGTLAADIQTMSVCLREAFIDQYSETDVLGVFRDEITAQMEDAARAAVPPVPEKGNLDLSQVRKSDFFFA
jgi:DNA-directed RNA polymerase